MTNPFDTPAGRQAQLATFRRLAAAGDGAISDFAKEVVAGRASPRELLTTGWVVESWIDDLRTVAQAYQDAPAQADEWSDEEAVAFIERDIAERVEAEEEPKPPPTPRRPVHDEDDGEDGPPLLKDAW